MDTIDTTLDAPPAASIELTAAECHALLKERGWGVVSIVDATDRPYAVPLAYAFDGAGLYVATGQGRKLRALDHNPTISLTVLDVERFDQWRSTIVMGTARQLWAGEERLAALRAFIAQRRPTGFELTPADAMKLMHTRIFRIEIAEISGRRQSVAGEWPVTPDRGAVGAPDVDPSATAPDLPPNGAQPGASGDVDAMLAMQGLRRLVRALRTTSASVEHDRGVTSAQLFVLRELANAPGSSVSELARRTLTSQPAVSEVIARLTSNGLVVRTPAAGDRRRADLRLTAAGERILAGAPETVQERLVGAFQSLARDDRRLLAAALDRWLAAAGLDDTPATMFFEPPAS
jgi:nitroimidazol reductase NimA-like FMN-containing flavoprotein (pyridoxamine 5'-phosphate oxidase superfamily)/DNA-binding MarR family transcriptional regulator